MLIGTTLLTTFLLFLLLLFRDFIEDSLYCNYGRGNHQLFCIYSHNVCDCAAHRKTSPLPADRYSQKSHPRLWVSLEAMSHHPQILKSRHRLTSSTPIMSKRIRAHQQVSRYVSRLFPMHYKLHYSSP
jgi:hypothetical protein